MLVFTRKRDEAIVIGDGIEVRVLRVGRDHVKLGVRAPADVAIHRMEVYDQIRAANRSAALSGPLLADEHESGAPEAGGGDDGPPHR